MRELFYFGLCFALTVFCNHKAALAETALGNVSAEIKAPLFVSEVAPMNFGTILVNGSADTVSLGLSNDITVSGSSGTSGNNAQSGQFSASGTPNSAVSITFANGNLTGTGTAMNISNFIHSAGGSPQFDSGGDLTFAVGAELQINSSQATGSYTGTFQVSVNYQ